MHERAASAGSVRPAMDGGKQLLVWRPRSAAVQPPATAGHGRPPLAAPRSSASKRVIVEESESHNNQSRGRRYVRGRLLGRGGFAAVYELRELAEVIPIDPN
eukprot:SAG31_NODE_860_length_11431_cov_8.068920_15_plen_102_part_00